MCNGNIKGVGTLLISCHKLNYQNFGIYKDMIRIALDFGQPDIFGKQVSLAGIGISDGR